MSNRFFANPDSFLGAIARLLATDGLTREVAVVTYSSPELQETYHDNWNGGTSHYSLYLNVPINLYPQIENVKSEIEDRILEKIKLFIDVHGNDHLNEVKIIPAVVDDPQWREKAAQWLTGSKITNQGRVRSDNVAPMTRDGLLFRSQPEIHLYKAFKSLGLSFAPLPVFIRGGESYSRIEPDFVLVHKGIVMVVEVDGDTVHIETPSEAQARIRTLQNEGVEIERISASECNSEEKALAAAKRILESINKRKDSRR